MQWLANLSVRRPVLSTVIILVILDVGAASYLGLNLPSLLRAEENRKHAASADACIVIFLNGGPSHLDMWDPKPDAPAEVRGEFKPIPTSVPGVFFGEHLPKFARRMHRCTLVRSAHHSVNNAHAAAVYCALTGHDRGEIGGGARPDDYPCIGSVVGLRRPAANAVPPHVLVPKWDRGRQYEDYFRASFLGGDFDPMCIPDPSKPDFQVTDLSLPKTVSQEAVESRSAFLKAVEMEMKRLGLAPASP